LETSASCLSPQKRIEREGEVLVLVRIGAERGRERDRDDCIVTQRTRESEKSGLWIGKKKRIIETEESILGESEERKLENRGEAESTK
jgi:hypothetical protein